VVLWSGGKDSLLVLAQTLQDGQLEVVALITTVTREYDRISMHGVRLVLLEQQARSLDIPLQVVSLRVGCTNEEYEAVMRDALQSSVRKGVTTAVAGDIYLTEVRAYRERLLATVGMDGLFPLWASDPVQLARRFCDSEYKAVICCVDSDVLDGSFAGRTYDRDFVASLPPGVDPCGEKASSTGLCSTAHCSSSRCDGSAARRF
jgi:uncharacterized protein (TIGR00290 family)